MFTGIIESIGLIKSIDREGEDLKVNIFLIDNKLQDINIGDSIAVNGICLTVKDINENLLTFDISRETLSRTAPLEISQKLNLESSLRFNGKVSGHFVTGHVDEVGFIHSIEKKDLCEVWGVKVSEKLMKFIPEKGSVALNGTSLTINNVGGNIFYINLIPHTLQSTNLSGLKEGDKVNIEIDMIARYLQNFCTK
ncbi:riboflavin synthase [Methylophilaceae bacterium]|jgi:riboflavin synthase|nr:riboflavin synthase [Methylophilaceae bacterium]|tara:strand:- start:538 stop:1122 length:585 start_codon:yes stop_codon:yes gene_type:complete